MDSETGLFGKMLPGQQWTGLALPDPFILRLPEQTKTKNVAVAAFYVF
jgi:hypothetical protein